MKRMPRTLLPALLMLVPAWSAPHAQEHSFGLRAGSLQFAESEILGSSVNIDRRPLVVIDYNHDLESSDLDGMFLEGTYEWRRDTDSHLSMFFSGGVFSESATQGTDCVATVIETRGTIAGNPWRLGEEPNTTCRNTNTLEFTIYYFHLSPRWNFTTGKTRFWVGAGLGLWANMWREVADVSYTDIFGEGSIPDAGGDGEPPSLPAACTSLTAYRESDGNRRTTLPFSASAGFTYQFLAHWSLNIEDRYLFNATGNINMFRTDEEFEIGGNQILFGFAYKL